MTLAGLATLATGAMAQTTFLSEMLINPDGADNGLETVEITGPPGQSMTGWFFVVIEGDDNATQTGPAGTVDLAVSLDGLVLGANGVGVVRDGPMALLPAFEPETGVLVRDFVPDIENGSNTFVLGFGTPPAVGTDLDTNNDGTLDVPLLGFTVVDSFAMPDGDLKAGNPPRPPVDGFDLYADDLGGYTLPVDNWAGPDTPTASTYTPDAPYRLILPNGAPGEWAAGDVDGRPDTPGFPSPFEWDLTQNNRQDMTPPLPNDLETLRPNGLPHLDLGVRNLVWGAAPGAAISGTVALDQFTGALPATIEIDVRDSANVSIGVQTVTLGPGGAFSVNIPGAGHYILSTKFRTGLRRNVAVDATGGNVSGVSITLLNGNVDASDNVVNLADFLILAANYEVSPIADPMTDLNGDGACDLQDFLILAANYEVAGDN
jgi:hypothetical protein